MTRFGRLFALSIFAAALRPRYSAFAKTKEKTPKADGVAIPSTPEEFAEFLTDEGRVVALFGPDSDPQARVDWFNAYNDKINKAGNISKAVTEEVTASVTEWLKEYADKNERPDLGEVAGDISSEVVRRLQPGKAGGAEKSATYNPKAMGAGIDDMFEDSADYFKTIWHRTDPSDAVREKRTQVHNAFSESVPSEGGFLVPERLRSELLRVALETSIVRPRARVIPMESLRVPFPAIDSTSNVSSVFGGVIGYWTEEGATLTASSAKFRRLVLEAKKLTAYTQVPNELISDSAISFGAFIDTIFPEALAFYEDIAFFDGSGAGEPQGFLNATAAISITKETGQAANTIVWENLVKMYARMLPTSLSRAVWVASINTFPELATMALSVGTGGSAIWLNNGAQGPPMTILGRPVIFTEKANTLGAAGDINFVDFGFYLIGDRQVMSARSSEDFLFQTDETAFRIIERLDGRPWLDSAITPQNNSDTLSPFVKIAVRA